MENKQYVSDTESFKAISEAINTSNFKEALLISQSILDKNPEDEDAAEILLYCQLSLDQFKDALTRCTKQKKDKPFQYAYVLHKLGKNNEAAQFIKSLDTNIKSNPGIRHLEAQIAYKQDHFKESSEAYGQIMEDQKNWEGNEAIAEALKDNYSSLLLLEKEYERIVKLMAGGSSHVLESVRGWQNLSVAYAELGQFERSVQAFVEAVAKQRQRQEKDEFEENVLQKEGNDLQIQWLYLLQKISSQRNLKTEDEQGKLEQEFFNKFVGRFKQLLRLRTIEFNNELMLVNNYVGLKREKLASIAHRLEKILARKDKIPLFMRVHIQVNAVLTLLRRQKHKEGLALLKEVESSHPEATSIDPRILLLHLHTLVKSKNYEEAKQYLHKRLASQSHDDLFSTLLLAQIALLMHRSWNEPLDLLLKQLENGKNSALLSNLAFVMFIFRILLKLEKKDELSLFIKNVAQVSELSIETYKYIIEQALLNGFHIEVIELYETHNKRIKSEAAEGAYYEALMHVDPDKCVDLQEEVDHSDIYDLEKLAGLFEKHFGTGKRTGEKKVIKQVPGIEDKIEEIKKEDEAKKKKKKPHYPKGYDPQNPGPPPDPERWLPKWQRSKYRKKHGGASLLRGPQGGFQDAKTKSGAVEEVAVAKSRYGKKRNA